MTVLDVRPADEYALGHLPGAINVPLAELATRLAELDPSREVVAYCRGAYCVLSFEAVAALRARGLRPAAWRRVIPNGARPGCRSRRKPDYYCEQVDGLFMTLAYLYAIAALPDPRGA